MFLEIERKFLLKNDKWKLLVVEHNTIIQGYLCSSDKSTTRVRIYGDKAFLTIKGKTVGIKRKEFEYEIPIIEARELFKFCKKPLIEKTRHIIKQGTLKWEIDIFEGENKGLEFCEIELADKNQKFKIPSWLGKEITFDKKYYNDYLVSNPFKNW